MNIQRSVTSDSLTIHLVGSFEFHDCHQFQQIIYDCIQTGITDLTLDLRKLVAIGTSGLGTLLIAKDLIASKNGALEVLVPECVATCAEINRVFSKEIKARPFQIAI